MYNHEGKLQLHSELLARIQEQVDGGVRTTLFEARILQNPELANRIHSLSPDDESLVEIDLDELP